jgi:hypothetical protein
MLSLMTHRLAKEAIAGSRPEDESDRVEGNRSRVSVLGLGKMDLAAFEIDRLPSTPYLFAFLVDALERSKKPVMLMTPSVGADADYRGSHREASLETHWNGLHDAIAAYDNKCPWFGSCVVPGIEQQSYVGRTFLGERQHIVHAPNEIRICALCAVRADLGNPPLSRTRLCNRRNMLRSSARVLETGAAASSIQNDRPDIK